MGMPRWTLATATAVLVLPIAGPAFATAASDADTTFGQALVRAMGAEEEDLECGEPDGELPECDDTDADGSDGQDTTDDADDLDGTTEQLEELDDEDEEPEDEDETDDEVEDEDGHGDIVSTVARCAPRGPGVADEWGDDGITNHGDIVSAVARDGVVVLGDGETLVIDSVAAAEDLCERFAEADDEEDDGGAEDDEDAEASSSDTRRGPPDHAGRSGTADDARGGGGGPPAHAGQPGPPDHARGG